MNTTTIRFPRTCNNAPAASQLALECLIYWAENKAPLALAESAWDVIMNEGDKHACAAAYAMLATHYLGAHTFTPDGVIAIARDHALIVDFSCAGFPAPEDMDSAEIADLWLDDGDLSSDEVESAVDLFTMETADIQPTLVR